WLGIRFRCGCGLGPTRPQQRGRNGDPADAGVSGPFDAVTGTGRVVGPRDVRGTGLRLVAVRAEPLPVVRAGGPSAGDRLDVIALPDGRVAVRAAARGVAPGEEAPQRRREGTSSRIHRDQLIGGRVRVEATELSTPRRSVGAEGI